MLKIRDLGINVIPATMRPPEIGPGGGFDLEAVTCAAETCSSPTKDDDCAPSRQQCPNSKPPKEFGVLGLSLDAVVQLKQQLRNYIGAELAY
jgi:hypothetical protein